MECGCEDGVRGVRDGVRGVTREKLRMDKGMQLLHSNIARPHSCLLRDMHHELGDMCHGS